MRVLIVEGDEDLASFFQTALRQRAGREPETVMTVEAATARLTTTRMDVVIVDVDEVRLSAPDVIDLLRLGQADLNVIVIGSGVSEFGPVDGVTVIEKPMTIDALWRVVERGRRRAAEPA